ncbi:hypothetical protein CA54_16040 [Symmachiella macrocystis]|uniref:Uncharacterized protein n=1 Tax=Symmachiella macrocystis TaxID=2527985 RepID=A0A5C6BP42_9PLAN|nr:hypothetical protein CA54_16040 [Symmachiella macrocystis]
MCAGNFTRVANCVSVLRYFLPRPLGNLNRYREILAVDAGSDRGGAARNPPIFPEPPFRQFEWALLQNLP